MTLNNTGSFPLLSGHPSLDLVNTELVRRGIRHDLLIRPEDLTAWLEALHMKESLPSLQHASSEITKEALNKVKEFRMVVRDMYERLADGQEVTRSWIRLMEACIAKAPLSYHFIDGRLVPVPLGTDIDAILSLVALDALRLLEAGELAYLHRCSNPECVLLYVDRSGRRKWCSMKICGNRNKVARNQAKKDHHQDM
ncbi:CGNR zinc finger domain-containing protein [Paenibacillus cellulositrophicus]|uniref:CGNR zinc finger domain-containing protein n=1 Tax=Paenibacillus cellulositrophicus TaxID=562959 RepID=UPI00203E28F5|nr:CGNR zinc finger domain-containing protein [Paenibacillus cellulositrophicus]MCM2998475.1 CGNR zinc finger domain-containing protein [Paenibacillus cellulositrophicus]